MVHMRVAVVMLNIAAMLKDDAHLAVESVGDFAAKLLHGGGRLSTSLCVVFRYLQAVAIASEVWWWKIQLQGVETTRGACGVTWKERLVDDETVFEMRLLGSAKDPDTASLVW